MSKSGSTPEGRARLAVRGRARGHVERRILVEEPDRLEHEPGPFGWHDRPVLGPGDVVTAAGIAERNVGVLDRAVGFRPGGEPGATRVLVRVIACREPLIGMEGGDPQVLRREYGALVRRRVGVTEREHAGARDELVGGLVA